MKHLATLLFATLASAAVLPQSAYPVAQPGSPVRRAEVTGGPITIEGFSSGTNIIVSVALVSAAPDSGVFGPSGNAVRVNGLDSEYESSSWCKPSSMCFDGITCGLRYGGCYDANFCAGSTSFPVPTTACDPSDGLTPRLQKRSQAAAGGTE